MLGCVGHWRSMVSRTMSRIRSSLAYSALLKGRMLVVRIRENANRTHRLERRAMNRISSASEPGRSEIQGWKSADL